MIFKNFQILKYIKEKNVMNYVSSAKSETKLRGQGLGSRRSADHPRPTKGMNFPY